MYSGWILSFRPFNRIRFENVSLQITYIIFSTRRNKDA